MPKALRISLWVIGGIVALLLVVLVVINTRLGKDFVRDRAVSFLEKKLGTKVEIGDIDYTLPKMVSLKNVYLEDEANNPVLSAKEIKLDIALLRLIKGDVSIQQIYLDSVYANMYRRPSDTAFNIDYIIEAFTPPGTDTASFVKDSTAKTIMEIDKVVLHDVHFNLMDTAGGLTIKADVGDLNLTTKEIDPEKLIFRLDKLFVKNTRFTLLQDTSVLPPKPIEPYPYPLQLDAEELNLQNVAYRQENKESKFLMNIKVGKLLGHPRKMDLPSEFIAVNDLLVENALVDILVKERSGELAEMVADTLIVSEPLTEKWRITAGDLDLKNVGFVLNNENYKRQPSAVDYAHLNVKDLVLDATDVNYTMDTIEGVIHHLALKEQSGFELRELKTKFSYHPQGGFLKDLYLETPQTILRDYASITYPSMQTMQKNPGIAQVALNLDKSIVGLKDVLLFAPQLQSDPFFKKHRNGMVKVSAKTEGKIDALNIEELELAGLGSTELNLEGKLNNITNPDRLNYDLNIFRLRSSREDIEFLLPPASLKQIRLPDRFGVTGSIKGSPSSNNADIVMMSTDGNATVKGYLSMGAPGKERYDLDIKTKSLDLGRILKQDTLLGVVTADITAKGQGFDVNSMNATASGTIQSAGFKRYTYHDVNFSGSIKEKLAKLELKSNDKNARLKITGTANFNNKYPAIYADADIDSIDLKALHFSKTDFRIHGIVHADIPVLNPDYPKGRIVMKDPVIATKTGRYFPDSLYIVANPGVDTGNNIVIRGEVINAHLWGKMPLTKIGSVVQYHIDRHYAVGDSLGVERNINPADYGLPQNYDLHLIAKVDDVPLMQGFVPELKSMDTMRIEAGLSPEKIFLKAETPNVNYAGFKISDANILVNGDDAGFGYVIKADRIRKNQIDIWYAQALGGVQNSSITSNISIFDKDSSKRYGLSATLKQNRNEQVLHLDKGLMLNYEEWKVDQDNRIVFAKPGFYVENFSINKDGEQISINSKSPQFNAPLRVDISDFLLANITSILSRDTLLANGIIGGYINLDKFDPEPMLTSEITIKSLSVLGDTLGNVDLNVKSSTANTIATKMNISGNGNDISLAGDYYLKPVNGNNFNMKLNLRPLNVASFQGMAMGQVKNSSGFLRGNLSLKGTVKNPILNGELTTDSLSTNIALLNTQFTMPSETIRFSGQNAVFNNFNIRDKQGNLATVNGNINFTNMALDLRLRANDWQLMNSDGTENQDFYGKMFITTNMSVGGTFTAPEVDGSLSVLKGTDMTIVVPERSVKAQEMEGIVKFVDMSHPDRRKIFPPEEDTVIRLGALPVGSELNLNITVNEEASFTVIVDQGTGDFVKVRGKSDVNTYVMPDGTLGLVGTYEIVDGHYQLNYNFLRRLFRIQKGSTITFSGNPEEAQLNVTAIYEANVPPYDLVARQVTDPADLVFFKQRLPFEVHMMIKGEMLHPAITFDITLPEEGDNRVAADVSDLVRAKLAQLRTNPSDLNKQVFALIVLNRFAGENIFESGAGGREVEAIARQSVSRFLTEQLNTLAGELFGGLELTLDVQTSEDFTTGERRNRTDLTVGASKRLLNDRLTVNVGNNFQLEGPQTGTRQNASVVPGNLSVDYDLTADRRYRIRFYRREEEQVFDENIIATGASFIMQVEYNRFKYAFIGRKKREQLRQERRRQWEERRKKKMETVQALKINPESLKSEEYNHVR